MPSSGIFPHHPIPTTRQPLIFANQVTMVIHLLVAQRGRGKNRSCDGPTLSCFSQSLALSLVVGIAMWLIEYAFLLI